MRGVVLGTPGRLRQGRAFLGAMAAVGLCLAPMPGQAQEGPAVQDIRVEGLQRTRPSLVLQQLASRVGEPYTPERKRLDSLYLDRLGIFSSIEITPKEVPGGVLLHVQLKETLPVAPYVSATVTQENGPSVGPAVGAINLFGKAWNANVAVEFGGAANVYLLMRSPRLSRRPWWYEFGYSRVLRDNPVFHFEERSQQPEAALGYQFRPDLALAGRFRFLSLQSDRPGITLSPSRRDQIPALMLQLSFDRRDSWSNPLNGWYVAAEAVRNGTFGGDGQWWTRQFDVRRYQKLSDRHSAVAYTLLTLQSGAVGRDIPLFMTYGIGGANSVRGWQVGARQGKDQWLNTAEYRFQLVKPRSMRFFHYNLYWGLQLAVYGDLGTAWSAPRDFSHNFIGGVGYGVRLLLPYVGEVRFDRAYGNGLRPCYGLGQRPNVWSDRIR